jgi:hypothetical protein
VDVETVDRPEAGVCGDDYDHKLYTNEVVSLPDGDIEVAYICLNCGAEFTVVHGPYDPPARGLAVTNVRSAQDLVMRFTVRVDGLPPGDYTPACAVCGATDVGCLDEDSFSYRGDGGEDITCDTYAMEMSCGHGWIYRENVTHPERWTGLAMSTGRERPERCVVCAAPLGDGGEPREWRRPANARHPAVTLVDVDYPCQCGATSTVTERIKIHRRGLV